MVHAGFLSILGHLAQTGNPIVANSSIADPHIHIFDGVAYLYAGRDGSPGSTGFSMPDWHVWTSRDLIHWKHATTILPTQTYIGNSTECWATDVARSADRGTFAFFFSHGGSDTGVMTATDPTLSDAKDALGRPLLASSHQKTRLPAVHVTNLTRGAYDPTLLVDDDGCTYICVGVRLQGSYVIARLEPSLVALAEDPRAVVVDPNPDTGAEMPGDDKSTLHKRGDTYYLSAGSFYATSTSVYGPYTFRGSSSPQMTRANTTRSFGDTHQAHGRFFEFRGQWFHVWCEFISENNTGVPPTGRLARYRDSWMTYTHYLANGDMADDWGFLDRHGAAGVGRYDAAWGAIEAEWFMTATHADTVQTNGAASNSNATFGVRFRNASSTVGFPNVANLPAQGTLALQLTAAGPAAGVAAAPSAHGELAVYSQTDSGVRGALLARCGLSSLSSISATRVTCPFAAPEQRDLDLLFVFTPSPTVAADAAVQLDSWSIAPARKA